MSETDGKSNRPRRGLGGVGCHRWSSRRGGRTSLGFRVAGSLQAA